jgi:hypothetical protein
MTNHQRVDSISNAHVGNQFEIAVQQYLARTGIVLEKKFPILVGVNGEEKSHNFDLGSSKHKILVECKSHRWTVTDNVPSAKLTVWNEAMLYFLASPDDYRKLLFVLRDFSSKRNESLAHYYMRTHGHLVPKGVEIWEYEDKANVATRVHAGK